MCYGSVCFNRKISLSSLPVNELRSVSFVRRAALRILVAGNAALQAVVRVTMKRERSNSSLSDDTFQDELEQLEIQGAEVLCHLRLASWQGRNNEVSSPDPPTVIKQTYEPPRTHDDPVWTPAVRPAPKLQRPSLVHGATRSYVWRGPCRKSNNRTKGTPRVSEEACKSFGDSSCSDEEELNDTGDKQRDKDWAALTTWLRMNLHHPRTAKRAVLFVGNQDANRHWTFDLNPVLSWEDVSLETKLRLKTLPQETEAAFARKYPNRPRSDWGRKTQKYRPPGSTSTVIIPLVQLITSLQDIYYRRESELRPDSDASSSGGSPPEPSPSSSRSARSTYASDWPIWG